MFILHSHELPTKNFSRMFPGWAILGGYTITDHRRKRIQTTAEFPFYDNVRKRKINIPEIELKKRGLPLKCVWSMASRFLGFK